jgi:hypothetical protein
MANDLDRLIDVLLCEELGGEAPPDLEERVLARAGRRQRIWLWHLAAAAAVILRFLRASRWPRSVAKCLEPVMPRAAQCPKCHAALPRKGRFCPECGLDLYAQGVRTAPSPWIVILVGTSIAAAVAACLVTWPTGPREAPEVREVQAVTRKFLRLAAEKRYDEIVWRFYEPDAKHFEETSDKLSDIVGEKGAVGLRKFRSLCGDDRKEANLLMSNCGTPGQQDLRQYLLGLLGALKFQNGELRSVAEGTVHGKERTAAFLAWYVRLSFEGADMGDAEIAERVGWEDAPDGDEKLFYVKLRYAQPPEVIPGLPDPAVLPWRRLDSGRWVLAFGESDFHFGELLDFLQRLKL